LGLTDALAAKNIQNIQSFRDEPELEQEVAQTIEEPEQQVAQTIEAPEPWRAPVARMY
jgi:hypothetical protein